MMLNVCMTIMSCCFDRCGTNVARHHQRSFVKYWKLYSFYLCTDYEFIHHPVTDYCFRSMTRYAIYARMITNNCWLLHPSAFLAATYLYQLMLRLIDKKIKQHLHVWLDFLQLSPAADSIIPHKLYRTRNRLQFFTTIPKSNDNIFTFDWIFKNFIVFRLVQITVQMVSDPYSPGHYYCAWFVENMTYFHAVPVFPYTPTWICAVYHPNDIEARRLLQVTTKNYEGFNIYQNRRGDLFILLCNTRREAICSEASFAVDKIVVFILKI